MPVRLRLLMLFYRTKSTDINKKFQINFTTIKLNIPFQFTALSLLQLTTQYQIRSAFKFLFFNIHEKHAQNRKSNTKVSYYNNRLGLDSLEF